MYFQPLLKGLAIIFSFGHKKTLSSEFSDTHQKAPRKLVGLTLRILLFYLAANLRHIEFLDLLQQVFQCCRWQRASLAEDQDAIAEDHQRRNGLNLQRGCEALVSLGIELGKGSIRVPVSYTHLTLPTNREV